MFRMNSSAPPTTLDNIYTDDIDFQYIYYF